MKWFLTSRSLGPIVTGVALLIVVTCALTGVYAPLPAIATPSGLGVPAVLATPVLAGTILLGGLLSANPARELIAIRAMNRIDRTLALAAVAVSASVLVAFSVAIDNTLLQAGARNLVGSVGLGLLARRWMSPTVATVLPVALAAVTFSLADRTTPPFWAWLLAPPTSWVSHATALGLLVLGATIGVSAGAQRRQLSDGSEPRGAR